MSRGGGILSKIGQGIRHCSTAEYMEFSSTILRTTQKYVRTREEIENFLQDQAAFEEIESDLKAHPTLTDKLHDLLGPIYDTAKNNQQIRDAYKNLDIKNQISSLCEKYAEQNNLDPSYLFILGRNVNKLCARSQMVVLENIPDLMAIKMSNRKEYQNIFGPVSSKLMEKYGNDPEAIRQASHRTRDEKQLREDLLKIKGESSEKSEDTDTDAGKFKT